jgi:RHS repeat-associated protein
MMPRNKRWRGFSATNAFKVSRRYTGQVLDEGTGLYYYNARYYDPVLGRFTQPDDVIQDIFNPQTYNRYSYCVNNPLRYTDPTGKDFVLNAGLVNGPVPYMTAKSILGQIGASVYNMFPLVDNSIHQGLNAIAAVDHAAGDVLHATTLAVTGDSQLAENSRNLTLLVGGIGEVGKIAKVDEVVIAVEKTAGKKTYQTYTKINPDTGKVYSGRTSGIGMPEENVLARDASHHKNVEGYGPAQLDKSSSNRDAIRGREQQLINANGGAQSTGGTSGNAINGVSPSNPKASKYNNAANNELK